MRDRKRSKTKRGTVPFSLSPSRVPIPSFSCRTHPDLVSSLSLSFSRVRSIWGRWMAHGRIRSHSNPKTKDTSFFTSLFAYPRIQSFLPPKQDEVVSDDRTRSAVASFPSLVSDFLSEKRILSVHLSSFLERGLVWRIPRTKRKGF